jgi:hypothetical protein
VRGADWQTTAWNGLTLDHPATWEVARLDADQLLWRDGPKAALEIRWALHRGRFDSERQFRRFARQARRKGLPQPDLWPVPESWRAALGQFTVSGFRWRRADLEGRGLLVYCPHCRRLSLIQIHPVLADQPQLIPPLLGRFRDHPARETMRLRIFGIDAHLPLGTHLSHFRFETGHYRLLWRKDRLRIGLHRWAPAGTILDRQPLLAFAEDQFQLPAGGRPHTELQPMKHGAYEAVGGVWSWAWNHGPQAISVWLATRLPRRFVRVWHVPTQNCLMGVEVGGRSGGLTPMFEQLCHHYEAISQ